MRLILFLIDQRRQLWTPSFSFSIVDTGKILECSSACVYHFAIEGQLVGGGVCFKPRCTRDLPHTLLVLCCKPFDQEISMVANTTAAQECGMKNLTHPMQCGVTSALRDLGLPRTSGTMIDAKKQRNRYPRDLTHVKSCS